MVRDQSDGERKCVCEVGVDRVYPEANRSSAAVEVSVAAEYADVALFASSLTGRRKLAQIQEQQRVDKKKNE